MNMTLSIIIPAYNEGNKIATTLHTITSYLPATLNYEILVVTNGCTDLTAIIVQDFKAIVSKRVCLIDLKERGKGLAVRTGMLMAKGQYRYMCDADLSTPITALESFLRALSKSDGIVIGSREDKNSNVNTTLRRYMIGRIFNTMAGWLVPGIKDTQCGFKMFTGPVAEQIFSRCRINGMAFDVEALYLAQQAGLRIIQLPVRWKHNPDSRVRLVRDSARMAADLARIWAIHATRMPQVKNKLPI